MPSGAELSRGTHDASVIPGDSRPGTSSFQSPGSETVPQRQPVRSLPRDHSPISTHRHVVHVPSYTEPISEDRQHEATTPAPSEAQRFLDYFEINYATVYAMTCGDVISEKKVLRNVAERVRAIEPHIPESAPPHVDARLEVASGLIGRLSGPLHPRIFDAGVRLLKTITIPAAHDPTLRRELVHAIHQNDTSDYPSPQTERLLKISKAVSHHLPHDELNGKLLMDAWASYIDRFSDDKEREAVLTEVCKLFQLPRVEGRNSERVHSSWRDGAMLSVSGNLGYDGEQLGNLFDVSRGFAFEITRRPQIEQNVAAGRRGEMREVHAGHILDILADGSIASATELAERADGKIGDGKNVAKVIKTMLPTGVVERRGSTNGARYRRVPVQEWGSFVPEEIAVSPESARPAPALSARGDIEGSIEVVTDSQVKEQLIAKVLAAEPDMRASARRIGELTGGDIGAKNAMLAHLKAMREAGRVQMTGIRGREEYVLVEEL